MNVSTDQLFEKAVIFTDIHFGKSNDSRQHNIDCENFIIWMIEEAKKAGAETCFFNGDWHHNRSRINVSTINYTISNIERLSKAFKNVYLITGNHDLYYRDKREINSIEFGRQLDNVHIISEIFVEGQVAIVPWMVGEEWKRVRELECKYMMAHFELPHFKMNAMVEMPDTGELRADDLTKPDYVFSGHFHKRQIKNNIHYTGNCFPHDFSDAWDDDRGICFIEWGGKPEYKSWPKAPKYRKIKLSQLLQNPPKYIDDMTYIKIENDLILTYEMSTYLREMLEKTYDPRDLSLSAVYEEQDDDIQVEESDLESVDSIVLKYVSSIESNTIDSDLLMQIYRTLSL